MFCHLNTPQLSLELPSPSTRFGHRSAPNFQEAQVPPAPCWDSEPKGLEVPMVAWEDGEQPIDKWDKPTESH